MWAAGCLMDTAERNLMTTESTTPDTTFEVLELGELWHAIYSALHADEGIAVMSTDREDAALTRVVDRLRPSIRKAVDDSWNLGVECAKAKAEQDAEAAIDSLGNERAAAEPVDVKPFDPLDVGWLRIAILHAIREVRGARNMTPPSCDVPTAQRIIDTLRPSIKKAIDDARGASFEVASEASDEPRDETPVENAIIAVKRAMQLHRRASETWKTARELSREAREHVNESSGQLGQASAELDAAIADEAGVPPLTEPTSAFSL